MATVIKISDLPLAGEVDQRDLLILEQTDQGTNKTTKVELGELLEKGDTVQIYPESKVKGNMHNGIPDANIGGTLIMGARDEFLGNMGNSLKVGKNSPPLMAEVLILPSTESSEYLIGLSAKKAASDTDAHLPLADIVSISHFGYTGIPGPFAPADPLGGAFYAVKYLGDIPLTVNMRGTISLLWRPTALSGVFDYPRLVLNWTKSGTVSTQPEIQSRQELGVCMGATMRSVNLMKFVTDETNDPINPTTGQKPEDVNWFPVTFHVNREITFIPGETYTLTLRYTNNSGATRNFFPQYRVRIEQGGLSFMMNMAPFIEDSYYGNN